VSDEDEIYDVPPAATDGATVTSISRNGKPIDEHEPAEETQLTFEFEDPGSRQSFGTLIPKGVPIHLKMRAKGKTLAANDTRPDVSEPVDRVTEQVVERVTIDLERDEQLQVTAATVTYMYGTRGVWGAKSEAARVALGLE
jgi:hypothetical protein